MAITPRQADAVLEQAKSEREAQRRNQLEEKIDKMLSEGARDLPCLELVSDAEVEWVTKLYGGAGWNVERKIMCDRAYLRFTPKEKR